MALFLDGFDYYNGTGVDQLQSVWDSGSGVASISVLGLGAFGYGRGAVVGATALSKTFANITGGGAGQWGTVYGCLHYIPNGTLGDDTQRAVQLIDGATNQLNLRVTAAGIIKLYRDNTLLATGTNAMTAGLTYFLAFKAVISTGAGSFVLFLSGPGVYNLTEINYAGDTANTANDYATKISFVRAANGTGAQQTIDNVHIYDGTDGAPWNALSAERRIYFGLPTADGASVQWAASAGSDYQCLDENPPNGDTDYISSSTATNRTSTTTGALASVAIDAVKLSMYARRDDAGPRGIKLYTRIGGVNYDSAEFLQGASYQYWAVDWLLSPATAAAWGLAELNGAEWGVLLST